MLAKNCTTKSAPAQQQAARPRASVVVARASSIPDAQPTDAMLSRRAALAGAAASLVALNAAQPMAVKAAPPASQTAVGTYLPPAGVEDFVLFVPDSKKTPVRACAPCWSPNQTKTIRASRRAPRLCLCCGKFKEPCFSPPQALRAGTVDPSKPYRFAIPPAWSEQRVNNTASGNYCQPRCDEPWTEVVFANDAEGRLELIVAPLKKLTPRVNIKASHPLCLWLCPGE